MSGCSVFADFSGLSSGTQTLSDASSEDAQKGDGGDAPSTDAAVPDGAPIQRAGDLFDPFDRADGMVGNGWFEKTAGAFSISGQVLTVTPGDWLALSLYRASNEDVADVETSVELRWSALCTRNCDPTLLVRIQNAAAAPIGQFFGYAAFIDDTKDLVVERVDQSDESELATTRLPDPVDTSHTYRMRFRVQGASPVSLTSTMERRDGTAWTTLATVVTTDSSSKQIKAAGSVGVTSDAKSTFAYDNFSRTAL